MSAAEPGRSERADPADWPSPLMRPELEYCFELRCRVEDAIPLGGAEPGEGLHFARVSGGDLSGPRLRGRILDGGGDWWDGQGFVVRLDARYVIEAELAGGGSAGVEVVNRGVWRTEPEVFERMLAEEPVSEQELYYRTAFQFRTQHPELRWLAESVFVGYARPEPGTVVIRVFRLV